MRIVKTASFTILALVLSTLSSCLCAPEPAQIAPAPAAPVVVAPAPVPAPAPVAAPAPAAPAPAPAPAAPAPAPAPAAPAPAPAPARPSIAVSRVPDTFSPDGDGKNDFMIFGLNASRPADIESWNFSIKEPEAIGPSAKTPTASFREWGGAGAPPSTITWDGKGSMGEPAKPAVDYPYFLTVQYKTGETVVVEGVAPVDAAVVVAPAPVAPVVVVPAPAAPVVVAPAPAPAAPAPAPAPAAPVVVVPAPAAPVVVAPAPAPAPARPSVAVSRVPDSFSPDGDGKNDLMIFGLNASRPADIESWNFSIKEPAATDPTAKTPTTSFREWGGAGAPPSTITWDGKGSKGEAAKPAVDYPYFLTVQYKTGETVVAEGVAPVDAAVAIAPAPAPAAPAPAPAPAAPVVVVPAPAAPVVVELPPAIPSVAVSHEPSVFSPDGDGENDTMVFGLEASRPSDIESWNFSIKEPLAADSTAKTPLVSFREWGGAGVPPSTILWDGKGAKGQLAEAASDYPYYLTVKYRTGETVVAEGVAPVDVLVVKEGDKLKIRVANIVFRADHADFIGLDKNIILRNEAVIDRLATIFKKYGEYQIRIEGHANSVAKMTGASADRIATEEKNELIPLSTARAGMIKARLVEKGIAASRMTTAGLGSSVPVIDIKDVANRWKNRRVEFILIK